MAQLPGDEHETWLRNGLLHISLEPAACPFPTSAATPGTTAAETNFPARWPAVKTRKLKAPSTYPPLKAQSPRAVQATDVMPVGTSVLPSSPASARLIASVPGICRA